MLFNDDCDGDRDGDISGFGVVAAMGKAKCLQIFCASSVGKVLIFYFTVCVLSSILQLTVPVFQTFRGLFHATDPQHANPRKRIVYMWTRLPMTPHHTTHYITT